LFFQVHARGAYEVVEPFSILGHHGDKLQTGRTGGILLFSMGPYDLPYGTDWWCFRFDLQKQKTQLGFFDMVSKSKTNAAVAQIDYSAWQLGDGIRRDVGKLVDMLSPLLMSQGNVVCRPAVSNAYRDIQSGCGTALKKLKITVKS
jgi:hypothetical protein